MRWRQKGWRDQVAEESGPGGLLAIPNWRGRGGMIWLLLAVVLVAIALTGGLPRGGESGVNLKRVLDPFPRTARAGAPALASQGSVGAFAVLVVRDAQTTWRRLFRQAGIDYRPAKVVLFKRSRTSECGPASRSTGPLYCTFDRTLYLDLGFFRDVRRSAGPAGDFAQAYVIAHLFGHHVQNVLGITDQVRRGQDVSPRQGPELALRLESQAACLAGVWAHSAYPRRQAVQPALAVAAVRILTEPSERIDSRQGWAQLPVESRARWFGRGFDHGDPGMCNTFADVTDPFLQF